MRNITYHLATLADIPEMTKMRLQFQIEWAGPQSNENIDKLTRAMKVSFEELLNDSYFCWLAKDGEKTVSAGGLTIRTNPGNFHNPSGRVGYIMSMYTVPEYRRRGISTNILNRLTDTAREMGIQFFELHATKEGAPVYEKNGFKIHDEPTYRKSVE